jgi:hypothetical protein
MRAIEERRDDSPQSVSRASDHAHSERRNPLNCAFLSHVDEHHEQRELPQHRESAQQHVGRAAVEVLSLVGEVEVHVADVGRGVVVGQPVQAGR